MASKTIVDCVVVLALIVMASYLQAVVEGELTGMKYRAPLYTNKVLHRLFINVGSNAQKALAFMSFKAATTVLEVKWGNFNYFSNFWPRVFYAVDFYSSCFC